MGQCKSKCDVYSRVVGFYSPLNNWNHGKREEFYKRKTFELKKSLLKEELKVPIIEFDEEEITSAVGTMEKLMLYEVNEDDVSREEISTQV